MICFPQPSPCYKLSHFLGPMPHPHGELHDGPLSAIQIYVMFGSWLEINIIIYFYERKFIVRQMF